MPSKKKNVLRYLVDRFRQCSNLLILWHSNKTIMGLKTIDLRQSSGNIWRYYPLPYAMITVVTSESVGRKLQGKLDQGRRDSGLSSFVTGTRRCRKDTWTSPFARCSRSVIGARDKRNRHRSAVLLFNDEQLCRDWLGHSKGVLN